MKKIKAFTLAEVLVTLAIIGVVAALTIPVIVTKYKNKVFATQLEKNFTVITDAFQQAMANDDASDFGQTQIIQKINGTKTNSGDQSAFFSELGKILKISKSYNKGGAPTELQYSTIPMNQSYPATLSNSYPTVILEDGTILYFNLQKTPTSKDKDAVKTAGGTMWDSYGTVMVDLNGAKEPNTHGRDAFRFYVSQNGLLVPYGSMNYAIFINSSNPSNYYWKNSTNCSESGTGYFCTARVIEERDMTY